MLIIITVRRGGFASAWKFRAAQTFPIEYGTGEQPYDGISLVHFTASASNMTLRYVTLEMGSIEFFKR